MYFFFFSYYPETKLNILLHLADGTVSDCYEKCVCNIEGNGILW